MSAIVIIPGYGSEYIDKEEIVYDANGRAVITGCAYDDQTGGYNMPEGPCLIPYTLTVPVSCIRSVEPKECYVSR